MAMAKAKKYLISIESKGQPRFEQFFAQACFNEAEFLIFGVKGADLTSRVYYDLAVRRQYQPLSPSELGCTLSHIAALNDFISSDAEYAYIFEDDIKAKKDIDFESDLKFLPEGFVLSLGGVNLTICKQVRGEILEQKFSDQSILQVNKYFYDYVKYTMGYVLDKKAAKAMVSYHSIPKIADDWRGFLESYPDITYYMTDILDHPDVGQLSMENSLISEEREGKVSIATKPRLSKFLKVFLAYRAYKLIVLVSKLTTRLYPKK